MADLVPQISDVTQRPLIVIAILNQVQAFNHKNKPGPTKPKPTTPLLLVHPQPKSDHPFQLKKPEVKQNNPVNQFQNNI